MRKAVLYLLAAIVSAVFSMTSAGLGVDYSFSTEEYPSYGVLSYTFPSNERYVWSSNFAGLPDAANDWMVRTMSGGAPGFIAMPGGGFGVSGEQARTAIVGSNRGTAMEAWAEVAHQYANHDYPVYTGETDMLSRDTLWQKIRYTLDGFSFVPDPALDTDTTLGGCSLLRGTPYLYNINTITGLGFASAVDSAVMNVSGFTGLIIRKHLVYVRSIESEGNCNEESASPLNRLWVSPFVSVHDEDERGGYAPFRYKAIGGAFGYDREYGQITFGGALFFSRGRYTDRWAPREDESKSRHYAFAVYGKWYAAENLFVDAHAGYQHSRSTIRRELIGTNGAPSSPPAYHRSARTGATGDWLDAKTRTGTWWLASRLGYDFIPRRNVIVTPSVGLEYRRAGNSGFTVSDSVGIPFLEVENLKRHDLFMPVNLAAQYRLDMGDAFAVTFRAGGGFVYNFSNKGTAGSMRYAGMNRSVAIRGGKPGEGDWNVNMGATLTLRERWECGAEYRREGSGNYSYAGTVIFTF